MQRLTNVAPQPVHTTCPLMGSCTVDQRRSVQRQFYPPIAVAIAPTMPIMCQTWPLPLLRSKPVATGEIDVGNCPVKMLRCQPVKVLHALGDPHYNWHPVTPRESFEREKRPPGAKRNPRPTARVPAEQENIRCIVADNAVQIPWKHDNDAQAHRPRTFPRKGSRLGGKREHHRAVG